MGDEKMTIIATDENGEEHEYTELFTCENDGKTYVLFSSDLRDAEGHKKTYATIVVDPLVDNPEFLPIETAEEWCFIEEELENYKQKQLLAMFLGFGQEN